MGNPLLAFVFRKVTIADGASLSDAVNVQGYDVVSLQQVANTEGTVFTFQGSLDGETYADLYDNGGTEVSVTKSATLAQAIHLSNSVDEIKGMASIKVRTGASAAPTNQTSAATILVGLRAAIDIG